MDINTLKSLFCLKDGQVIFNKIGSVNISSRTHKSGYTRVKVFGNTYYLHHIVFALANGRWANEYVDHIDGNPKNNKPENLREVTHHQNVFNRRGSKKWKRYRKTDYGFVTMISCNKEHYYLGTYDTEEKAAYAYNVAAKILFGEYAYLNDVKYTSGLVKEEVIKRLSSKGVKIP